MPYYGYHQMIRKRIEAGELIGFSFVDDYPRIGKALVLQFSTMPHLRPIRPHRWEQYKDIWKGAEDANRSEFVLARGKSNEKGEERIA